MHAPHPTAFAKTEFVTPRRIGDLLVEEGLVSRADVNKALAFRQQYGGRIGSILVRLGALSEESLLPVLSTQLGTPLLEANDRPVDTSALRSVAERSGLLLDWWIDNGVVAWEVADERILVIARDILDPSINEILSKHLNKLQWEWRLARTQDIDRMLDGLNHFSSEDDDLNDEVSHLRELAEEAPVIEMVNNVLAQAMDQRASDVHIEPEEQLFHVRMRIDGILHTRLTLPINRYPAVASRIKLISGMDIAERRLPQDGRLSVRVSGREVDIRASSVPAVHGESLVLRLLPKERKELSLGSLGMVARDLALFRKWVREPHGIVLVTGPTGSGKSTTLYGALEDVNQRDRKIITVEDPVEYQVSGVTQIQASAEIGYTFARALRAILRQDPDVIMIGEIRDLETAEIAVQSALTGHLVLSTLHTNDAVSAFTRLIDMGVESFLVATSVRAVQAQRLVRRLCPHCSAPAHAPPAVGEMVEPLVRAAGHKPAQWMQAVGCAKCQGSGYLGRVGIYELVDVTPELQELVVSRATAEQMRAMVAAQGGRTLREDGLIKAWAGSTTVEEVIRVTGGLALDG